MPLVLSVSMDKDALLPYSPAVSTGCLVIFTGTAWTVTVPVTRSFVSASFTQLPSCLNAKPSASRLAIVPPSASPLTLTAQKPPENVPPLISTVPFSLISPTPSSSVPVNVPPVMIVLPPATYTPIPASTVPPAIRRIPSIIIIPVFSLPFC